MTIWDIFSGKDQKSTAAISSKWTELDAESEAKFANSLRKPIHIKRSAFAEPKCVSRFDTITLTWTTQYPGGEIETERTPPVEIMEPMIATHATKFELIDEFGDDCGVGIIIGGKKTR